MAAQRRWETLHAKTPFHDGNGHGWVKDSSEERPYHFADGATVWVAQVDLQQGGDFLKQHDTDAE